MVEKEEHLESLNWTQSNENIHLPLHLFIMAHKSALFEWWNLFIWFSYENWFQIIITRLHSKIPNFDHCI